MSEEKDAEKIFEKPVPSEVEKILDKPAHFKDAEKIFEKPHAATKE